MDPARAVSSYKRDAWGIEQGFPGGDVHAIAQGRDGHLWLGTDAGLVRFDGKEFRVVPRARGAGGAVPSVLGVEVDDEGSVWLRLDAPTLLRYRDGDLEDVPYGAHGREVAVTAMRRGRDGRLLIYAQVSGLLAQRESGFEPLAQETVPASVVLAMAQSTNGDIWLGTRESGLYRMRGRRMERLVAGLPNPKVNCILALEAGELWVGTDRGIVRWNGKAFTTEGVPSALWDTQALAMLRDRDRNVWVGTSSSVLRATGPHVSALPERPGEARGAVMALYEDREGSLWIGGANGVERLRETPFTAYSREPGLPSGAVGPIEADAHGRVFLASPAGGLYVLEGEEARPMEVAGLRDPVYSIAGARSGGLWLGRQQGGLTRLRWVGRQLQAVTYTEADGLAQNSVYAAVEGRDGSVWAGTLSRGLSRLQGDRFTTHTTSEGLASNTITALLETHDGTLWAATPAGLCAWSGGRWQTRGTSDGLPADEITALFEDSSGVLWVGTARGLAHLSAGRLAAPQAPLEPLREPVLGIAEGEGGWLFVSTAQRVMRVRRDAVLRDTVGEADLVSYGIADGLPGTSGVKRQRSVVTDPRGRIWIATNRGLAVVNPRRAAAPLAHPPVKLGSVTADGRVLANAGGVRVPAGQRRVTFAWGGVSLAAPERVRYRYRLDGFDSRWSEPVASSEAVYTNLAPGSYTFHVSASGGDGLWGGPEEGLAVSVAPSVWQTWWFQLTALVTVAGAARLAYRRRMRQVTRRLNALFDERLAERTRIARDLHDTLLQGFVSASMQLHVAVQQVPEGAPGRPLLQRVQQLVAQVIEEGRRTVRGLRSGEDGSLDLGEAFSRVREEMGGASAAELRVIVEGTPRPLHPSVRDGIYRIGREALVNAFLHSRARHVAVELEYREREVRLQVRDDGIGIDPLYIRAGREGHFGLAGMRERAETIGGRLRVFSALGAGTEIELLVPSVAASSSRPAWRGLLDRLQARRRGKDADMGAPARRQEGEG
jgi:signal transduction histidine kinase/ligand-binding sensor domain-containing protein